MFEEKSSSEYKYSKIWLLSLVSTSPLHSEIIFGSPDEAQLRICHEDEISLSDTSSLDWEESSEDEEIPEEKEERFVIVERQTPQDAPSPDDSETEEIEEGLPDEQGRCYDNPCTLADQFYQSLCRKSRQGSKSLILPWPYTRVTEREIIDKIFPMLLGLSNNFFEFDSRSNSFQSLLQLEISHLTPSSLSNFLSFFMQLSSLLISLQLKADDLGKDPCIAFQYLGFTCNEILSEFRKTILSMQDEFSVQTGGFSRESLQKFPGKSITLISLRSGLCSMLEQGKLLQEVTEKLENDPVLKTCSLLDHLFSLIQFNYSLTDHSSFSIFVRLFLSCLRPFISDLTRWLTQGTVNGLDPGFMIEKSPESTLLVDAWQLTFKLRSASNKEVVPSFMKGIKDQVLTVGKNMMLIRKIEENILDHVLPPASDLLMGLEKLVISKIFQECGHFLNHSPSKETLMVSSIRWDRNVPQPVQLKEMRLAFEFGLRSEDQAENGERTGKTEAFNIGDIMKPSEYLIEKYQPCVNFEESPAYIVKSWTSFKHVLDESIAKPVTQLHTDTCSYILKILNEKFHLDRYFKAIREVFLLENAENMRPLLKFINKTPDLSACRNNSYDLRNSFQECLKTTSNKDLASFFTCEIRQCEPSRSPIDSIELLSISFAAPTPLDICFDENSIKMYQKLNTRILQIKRAVFCAKNMKWRSRNALGFGHSHRKFMLFQKKLIHFSSCFEEYVLQDVLHSLAIWFLNEKNKVKSIDELRALHSDYLEKAIERCLLSHKKSPLSAAVNAVFVVCVRFFELMKKNESEEFESMECKMVFEDLEQNFETANRILLNVLSKSLHNKRQLNCNPYLDLNSYFTLNFNRFYMFD